MKWILFLVVVLLPLFGSSQSKGASNPGYMGKHFLISAEGSFSGSFLKMDEYWFKYGGAAEFVLGKRFSLGVSYMHSSVETFYFPMSDDCYSYPSFTFNTNAYNMDFYFYTSQSIAPLGSFFRLQATYMRNYTNDFYQHGVLAYDKDPYSCPTYAPSADSLKSYNIRVSLFYGRKRIFYNSLVVSYGVQFGVTVFNPLTYIVKSNKSNASDIFYKATCYENFFSSFIVLNASIGGIW